MKIGDDRWKALLKDGARDMNIVLSEDAIEKFLYYADELVLWNRSMNLTTITDPQDIAVRHFIDSLAPGKLFFDGATVLDVGSGGGFPGIPLKLAFPSLSVLLLDSSRKRVSFMNHIVRRLGLKDIYAVHARAQDAAFVNRYTKAFDFVVSRALCALDQFIRLAMPLLSDNGILITLKGKLPEKEMEAARAYLKKISGDRDVPGPTRKIRMERYFPGDMAIECYIVWL